jgi:Fic family protein
MAPISVPIGYLWLRQKYDLEHQLTHQSFLGTRPRLETEENGNILETYPPKYAVEENPLKHVEFGLKYDNLSLDFLKTVFNNIPQEEVIFYILAKPRGIYQRRIGFLYEFLMGIRLRVESISKVNYVNLLDPEKYVTGSTEKDSRWWINNNLPGTNEFCPVIRKTNQLTENLRLDFKLLVRELIKKFPMDIFYRAVNYLYRKETKSSYQIEREQPTTDRVERFVSILEKAGEEALQTLLSETALTKLQNAIVDTRFAVAGYRQDQNFISSTNYNFKETYHYISPPPQFVPSLMNGLALTAQRIGADHSVVQAATIAFAFVFIHPFEDGNGRIHRFLIHDLLTRNQVVDKGMIIPVSAHMLNYIKEYDQILEKYSKPLMKQIAFKVNADQSITVTNPDVVEGYYRYPDLTEQSTYLARIIRETIEEDVYNEMDFLMKYDEIKSAIQKIVDIPDRQMDRLIKYIHNNHGRLSKRKRDKFEKLTDAEIGEIETAFREIFGIFQ